MSNNVLESSSALSAWSVSIGLRSLSALFPRTGKLTLRKRKIKYLTSLANFSAHRLAQGPKDFLSLNCSLGKLGQARFLAI
jgi:hypothetical protein